MIGSGCFCLCSHEGFLRAEFDSETKRSNCVKPFVYSEKKFSFLDFFVHLLCDFWDVQFSFYKFCKYLPDIINIVVDLSACF